MLTRRQLLRTGGGSLLFGLLGGCGPGRIKPPDCDHFAQAGALNVIDVHCHIFNATDLQVEAFLRRVVAEGNPDSPIAIIAPAIQEFGWNFAPNARDELRWLTQRRVKRELVITAAPSSQFGAPPTTAVLPQTGTDSQSRFESFYAEFKKRRPQEFEAFARKYYQQTSAFRVQQLQRGFASPAAAAMETPEKVSTALSSSAGLNVALANEGFGGAPPVLSFLKSFFRYRTENAWLALHMYGCDSTPGVDFLSPAMVDFDLWLGDHKEDEGRTRSHLVDQLTLAQEIARATAGRVHMFAPFNPRRAACDPSYVTLYQQAITEYGCIGFKLYPPMGFSPWNNEQLLGNGPLTCPSATVRARQLDRALADFYGFCAEHSLPIFAHASPSNGASLGSQLLGSPEHWEGAIAAHPALFAADGSKIRLSFGHFGGDHDVTSAPGGHWTEEFSQLIGRHSFVYGDLSYYARLLQGPAGQQLVASILRPILTTEPCASRLMYGSDWVMLGIESRYQHYLSEFNSFLTNTLVLEPAARGKIFGGNARRFLGLEANGAVRRNIDEFHRRQGQQWAFSATG